MAIKKNAGLRHFCFHLKPGSPFLYFYLEHEEWMLQKQVSAQLCMNGILVHKSIFVTFYTFYPYGQDILL